MNPSQSKPLNVEAGTHSERIGIVDAVRGIASLVVCLFHLAHHLPKSSALNEPTKHWGVVGVFMFFVVSGFVVPLSLSRVNPPYQVRDFFRYMLRRVIRLDPPYFASIILALAVIGLANLIPGYRGQRLDLDPLQLFLHIGYLNGIFGYSWANGVFWTLSLEFQFYVLIGCIFPLLYSKNPIVWRTVFWLLCLSQLLPTVRSFTGNNYSVFVYDYLSIFLMGIAGFQLLTRRINTWEYLISLAVLAWPFSLGLPSLVGVATSLLISFVRFTPGRSLMFLSNISYSLYLSHVPIGRSIVHLLRRVFPETLITDFLIVVLATLPCLLIAYLMYRFIEVPSLQLAKRLRTSRRVEQPVNAPTGETSP